MNRERWRIVALLLVASIAAGLTREWAATERNRGVGALPITSGKPGLSRMNSYALSLLLGGLRGPLVMVLWPSAEQQKNEKNLEDFDTKIEWIRLLQAEFDTVHIFQIWNKAWNISAQMANLSNKYRTILDALDYAYNVDAERPNNINIMYVLGRVYGDKLGESEEKSYYISRVREETSARTDRVRISLPVDRRAEFISIARLADFPESRLRFSEEQGKGTIAVTIPKTFADLIQPKFNGPNVTYVDRPLSTSAVTITGQRQELDPRLDLQGHLLDRYLRVTNTRPPSLDPASEWNDGSDLQYLKAYEPFPYGLSPFALSYNYYKRAQVLNTVNHQKPADTTEEVVGTRPAVALRQWADEELDRARSAEIEALFNQVGKTADGDPILVTADVPADTTLTRNATIDEAMYSYQRVIDLATASVKEYHRHMQNAMAQSTTYLPLIDDLQSQVELVSGDRAYLEAMLHPGTAQLHDAAVTHYQNAINRYRLVLLQYYIDDENAQRLFPAGTNRANIESSFLSGKLSVDDLAKLYAAAMATFPPGLKNVDNSNFIQEYWNLIKRAETRLNRLK